MLEDRAVLEDETVFLKPLGALKRSTAVLLAIMLAGCAGLRAPARPILPSPSELQCCWQSQERVRVSIPGEEKSLLAAVAVTPGKLTIVAFDPLGHRLVTLVHAGNTPQTLDAPPGWSEALSHQLLLAIYLHNLKPEQWAFARTGWAVADAGAIRTLSYRGRDRVRLHYAAVGAEVPTDVAARPRRVDYLDHSIQLDILTLSRNQL